MRKTTTDHRIPSLLCGGGGDGHIIHYHLQLRGRAAVAVPPSLDDCGAGFIIDEHFIDSSKARRSLDLFAVAKII